MAIYHLSIKIISRGKGRSAVAAAAYRAGETITNEYDGITHDYTQKCGVVHTEILLPACAPPEYSNRAVLWNAVEKVEKAKNSQLAREIELALPAELTIEQNIALVREYVKRHFVDAGMCADICVHDKNGGNPHAHIMLTMRPFNEDGTWGDKQKKEYILDRNGEKIYDQKTRQYKCKSIPATNWNEQTKAEEWRAAWADAVNVALERQQIDERVDHRAYERQGVEQVPTVHLGVAAFQMEKRGISTERGDHNRQVEVTNRQLRQLRARINRLKNWLEEAKDAEPPTLAEVIQSILDRRKQEGHRQTIENLKAAAQILNFLTSNGIKDMPGLEEKVKSMYRQLDDVRVELKPVERRLHVLDEHLKQAAILTKHKSIYTQYQQITKPRKQKKFEEEHQAEIALYKSAKCYFDEHMNGRTTLPIKAWQEEREKLIGQKNALYRDYYSLKDETHEVDIIRRSVEYIIREDARRTRPPRDRGMER